MSLSEIHFILRSIEKKYMKRRWFQVELGYMRDLNRVLGSQNLNLANFCGPFSDLRIFSDQFENIEISVDRLK